MNLWGFLNSFVARGCFPGRSFINVGAKPTHTGACAISVEASRGQTRWWFFARLEKEITPPVSAPPRRNHPALAADVPVVMANSKALSGAGRAQTAALSLVAAEAPPERSVRYCNTVGSIMCD
ncbi:hypothetical protein SBV1_460008 [Verrucomicrobia bacterium]|nr:hypothetical protein SBV1_460008 [Verrucomicrobiota bacterium]